MSEPRADVALLVDYTDLCEGWNPAAEGDAPAGGGGLASSPLPAAEVAASLLRFASEVGRVSVARAYADWSRCPDLAREVNGARLEPVLVPGTQDGEDRSHIRLVVDALAALYVGNEPDAFVLVTGDPTMLPLVQALRADGSEVVLVAPAKAAARELVDAVDRYASLEDVLAGTKAESARPRIVRSRESVPSEPAAAPAGWRVDDSRREKAPHPTPVASERDFEHYQWGPFVRLIDELEHRLPFVGVRYLVNKVLGPHNCGIDDPRLKRDLMNRAVDQALIEMYPVGNVGDRADPVTACRLDRKSVQVIAILGQTTTPDGPEEDRTEEQDRDEFEDERSSSRR
ncbi:MAG: NYN domain-containing protein [Planctomycetota bacterium]|jgi:hypothetical protein